MADFFSMGGYGIYVWGSYGFAALILVFNLIYAKRAHTRATKLIQGIGKDTGAL